MFASCIFTESLCKNGRRRNSRKPGGLQDVAFYTAKGRISRHDMRPFASLFAVYKKVVKVVKVVRVVRVVKVVKSS